MAIKVIMMRVGGVTVKDGESQIPKSPTDAAEHL